MFYRPGIDEQPLPHNPFKALLAPRPIGWISTADRNGRANLAPYSFFNAISDRPPMLMYCNTAGKIPSGEPKDTLSNIRETGEFVHNVVSRTLADAMNACSGHYPASDDEFEIAGLTKAPCEMVAAPRVAEAPASLECKLWKIIDLPNGTDFMVIGEVVGIHINDSILRDGIVDVTIYRPLSRLGYRDYASVDEVFSLNRPGQT